MAFLIQSASQFWRSLNNFAVYSRGRQPTYANYTSRFNFQFEHLADPHGVGRFVQANWHHSITISVFYYLSLLLLRRWMASRPAFQLRSPLIVWNCSLALFSYVGFFRMLEDVSTAVEQQGFYKAVCTLCNPYSSASFWSLLFFISKVIELGDTFLIVLRKRPLIFLHVYHHFSVLIYTAQAAAEQSSTGSWFMAMNFGAHSMMYTYYALCAIGYKVPRPIAMVVTGVQTLQMLAGGCLCICVYYYKSYLKYRCHNSLANLLLAFILYTTFLALFLNYFYWTYVNGRKRKTTEDDRRILDKKDN